LRFCLPLRVDDLRGSSHEGRFVSADISP
jgi:hypothetical protein